MNEKRYRHGFAYHITINTVLKTNGSNWYPLNIQVQITINGKGKNIEKREQSTTNPSLESPQTIVYIP